MSELILSFTSLFALLFGTPVEEDVAVKEESPVIHQTIVVESNEPLNEDERLFEMIMNYKNGDGVRPVEMPTGYEHVPEELLKECLPTRTCSGG